MKDAVRLICALQVVKATYAVKPVQELVQIFILQLEQPLGSQSLRDFSFTSGGMI